MYQQELYGLLRSRLLQRLSQVCCSPLSARLDQTALALQRSYGRLCLDVGIQGKPFLYRCPARFLLCCWQVETSPVLVTLVRLTRELRQILKIRMSSSYMLFVFITLK